MKTTDNNPKGNSLGPGVKEELVLGAINHSGYPLQSIIADYLRKNCAIQEEWSFIDRDTKELRALDIFAKKYLFDWKDVKKRLRARPILNLLTECKQSELPYVFFLGQQERKLVPGFPIIAGLANDKIAINTDDDKSTWHFNIPHVLDLISEKFVASPPYVSHTFSKCVRKGGDFELSGTESFHGLVLPLIKAQDHFKKSTTPPETVTYFDCNLTIAAAVLDAPMVIAQTGAAGPELALAPWVRVVRHESYDEVNWTERTKLLALDVIHKEFFVEYFEKHVMPFANTFADRVIKHDVVVAEGKAFIKGMGSDSWSNLEERLGA